MRKTPQAMHSVSNLQNLSSFNSSMEAPKTKIAELSIKKEIKSGESLLNNYIMLRS